MRGLIVLSLVPAIAACTAARPEPSTLLEPATWEMNGEPTIEQVNQDSDLSGMVAIGDKLVAVGEQNVDSYAELIDIVSNADDYSYMVTVARDTGDTIEFPMEQAFPGSDGLTQISWIKAGSTSVYSQFENPDGQQQISGVVYAGQLTTAMAVRRWETTPPLLEVQVAVSAPADCAECGFKNLGVLDLAHNSWVQPISIDKAAWAVYPDLGAAGERVPVPPPTPAGGTAFSNTYGSLNAHTYGGNTYGTYQGSTTTTYYPNYDYTATDAANMHNLGVAIRNARIENQNKARREFVAQRSGNLRLGELNPGETIIGHVFYALPSGFDGPFGVVVTSEADAIGWLRFDEPMEDQESN